jgi:hypothetical protein
VSKGEKGETAISPLVASLVALEHHRPDHIEAADWQHAVEDGRRFLAQWGAQAESLSWTEADIFGLPVVPEDPHPSWQRLARVGELGLVWLTRGRPVTSITAEKATIATPGGGALAFYRARANQEGREEPTKEEERKKERKKKRKKKWINDSVDSVRPAAPPVVSFRP